MFDRIMHDRTRHHHPARHHREEGGPPHGHSHHFHPRGEGGRHGGRHGGGPGGPGRARRGELRYVILDALRDGPRHGYEIIKAFEERTRGQYAPSPGTVYPTLQYLEELGLVRADQGAERKVYHLTDAGRAERDAHAEEINAFWADFPGGETSDATRQEADFLRDELEGLMRTVWGGARGALERDEQATILRVRQAVEQCRNDIRRILTGPASGEESPAPKR